MPPNGQTQPRRFKVALSFPGAHRPRVEAIAQLLAPRLGRDTILYDHWLQAELARPNLDIYLPNLYHEHSDLLVVFLCGQYVEREWCGLEWRVIRDLIKQREDERVMPLRLDDAPVPGFHSIDGYIDIRKHTDAQVADFILQRVAPSTATPTGPPPEAHIAKLPVTDATLYGRTQELQFLDQAWQGKANLVQIVAPGGTGKTALFTKWYKQHVGQIPLYGWSFYRQGTGNDAQVSSDEFLDHALTTLHLTATANTADAKVEALVHHLRQHKTLLLLDGLEPLQNHATGELNDFPLRDLLRELATQNPGLVLCTTRITLADLPDDDTTRSLQLDNLQPADAARYLSDKFGVEGTEEELRQLAAEYGHHALALTLLGTYLKRHKGDRSYLAEIDTLPAGDQRLGRHARRVMQAYAKLFAGKPEDALLRGLGFFDRPADRDALRLVLPNEWIDPQALLTLTELRLVETANPTAPIDCHPLVREHFGALTKSQDPEGFRNGHSRLFDHYCASTKEQRPKDLPGMQPLFYAVAHGCQAGRYEEARADVYRDRILHGTGAGGFYLLEKLGAHGTNLALLAHFFAQPWSHPHASRSPAVQSWLLNMAAFSLRAVGRLGDAVEPMRAGADARVQEENWPNAARSFGNLSELLLALGHVEEATEVARRSVEYADRSDDAFLSMATRTTLADALHQAGDREEAARLFAEAEQRQAKRQPDHPLLYSVQGYQYCDLILAGDGTRPGNPADAVCRAAQALDTATRNGWLLDIGLDHLTLGGAHPPGSPESRHHLDQAVNTLRRARQLDDLLKALLARATEADLAEVFKIATRSGMRLHLTDYHLAMARRQASKAEALVHLEKAEKLIEETGYHRRDREAAELRRQLTT